jgi:hypothetical protein
MEAAAAEAEAEAEAAEAEAEAAEAAEAEEEAAAAVPGPGPAGVFALAPEEQLAAHSLGIDLGAELRVGEASPALPAVCGLAPPPPLPRGQLANQRLGWCFCRCGLRLA